MNITEASKILNLSPKSLRRHIKTGTLQATITQGKNGPEYDVSEESLEAFKSKRAEQTILPTVEKQPGAMITLPNPGTPRQTVSIDTSAKGYPTLGIIDLGQGRVGHHKDIRLGRPGRTLDELPDICSVEEAAIYMGVGPQKVRDFVREGKLKGTKLGRGIKISKVGLEMFRKKLLG